MALRRILYSFTADGSQFRNETRQMGAEAESSFQRASTAALGIAAGLTTALATMQQLVEESNRLDLAAVERLIAAGLTGGDTATAQAWQITQSIIGGIGYEQVFDTAEALSDALRVKPRDVTQPVIEGIGLDRAAFLALETPSEQANMILDTLVARGGTVDDEVLRAASELGAGDIRDMASMAAVIAQVPEFHPRDIADRLRPGMPSEAEEIESARDALAWAETEAIADAEMSTRPWWSMHHAIRQIPFIGHWDISGDSPQLTIPKMDDGHAVPYPSEHNRLIIPTKVSAGSMEYASCGSGKLGVRSIAVSDGTITDVLADGSKTAAWRTITIPHAVNALGTNFGWIGVTGDLAVLFIFLWPRGSQFSFNMYASFSGADLLHATIPNEHGTLHQPVAVTSDGLTLLTIDSSPAATLKAVAVPQPNT